MSEEHVASDDPVAIHLAAMRKRDVDRHKAILAADSRKRLKLLRQASLFDQATDAATNEETPA